MTKRPRIKSNQTFYHIAVQHCTMIVLSHQGNRVKKYVTKR